MLFDKRTEEDCERDRAGRTEDTSNSVRDDDEGNAARQPNRCRRQEDAADDDNMFVRRIRKIGNRITTTRVRIVENLHTGLDCLYLAAIK